MAILNYTSKVEAAQTAGEILRILAKVGATRYGSVVKLQDAPAVLATPPGLYTTSPAREIVMPAKYTPEQRRAAFWSYVDKNGPVPDHRPELGPCWLWTGGVAGNGYGAFSVDGKQIGAHQFAYYLAHGVLAEITRHECDRPLCVNDAHLIDGTPKDNSKDRDSRGRGKPWPTTPERRARGVRHGRAKVTEDDVRAMRTAYAGGEASQGQLGKRYGLTQAVVGRIIRRKTWAHVE